ncbi:DUF4031 domain-containing protein, partial [Pseudomonas sp.]|uniref:DUF4031 domain-containing protein n=1 Tax=Pseudomonas sp. TaxID=306 RepID=UPI003C5A63E1
MAVYVDDMRANYGRMKMCHMLADSVEELLAMADKIGVDRKWFQALSSPHFDIALSKRALAVASGAIEVDRKGIVAVMKRHRAKFMSDAAELAAIRSAAALS